MLYAGMRFMQQMVLVALQSIIGLSFLKQIIRNLMFIKLCWHPIYTKDAS